MRVRLFVEVELNDEALLKQFGEQLPGLTQTELPAGTARATEQLMQTCLPHVKEVKAVFIPPLLL